MLPRFPAWLMALTDSNYPDVPWRVPDRLPALTDLRDMLARCDMVLRGEVNPGFAKQCIAKLMVAFEPNTKLSADETRIRAMVWLEACGDLNNALWAQATDEAIKSLKWMPKPSEFRALMQEHVDMAKRRQVRIQAMIEAHGRPQQAFVPEPPHVRIRGMRDSFRRVGDLAKAIKYERELAAIEERPVEDWANVALEEPVTPRERPPFVPSTSPTALRCAELARQRRQPPGESA